MINWFKDWRMRRRVRQFARDYGPHSPGGHIAWMRMVKDDE